MEIQIKNHLHYYIIECKSGSDDTDLIKMIEMSNALLPNFLGKV